MTSISSKFLAESTLDENKYPMEFECEEIRHGNVLEKLDPSQRPHLTHDAVGENPQQQVGVKEPEV